MINDHFQFRKPVSTCFALNVFFAKIYFDETVLRSKEMLGNSQFWSCVSCV